MSNTNINDNSVFDKQALARRLTELLDTYAEEVKEEDVWDICKPKIEGLNNKPIYSVSIDPYKEENNSTNFFKDNKFFKMGDINPWSLEELDKLENGYTQNGVYISGLNYFIMAYSKSKETKKDNE